jgi:hypothetical protein
MTTLSRVDVAHRIGASVNTVDRLRDLGQLVAHVDPHNGRVTFDEADVEAYLDRVWAEYWAEVARVAEAGPPPTGAAAVRLAKLLTGARKARAPTLARPPVMQHREAAR